MLCPSSSWAYALLVGPGMAPDLSPGILLVLVIHQKLNVVKIASVPEDFLFLICIDVSIVQFLATQRTR